MKHESTMSQKLAAAPWNVFETAIRLAKAPMETLDRAKTLAGDCYILNSVWGPVYVIADPNIVDALASDFSWNIAQTAPVSSESPEPFKQLAGDTVVTSEGYFHSHFRDSLRSQFSRSRLDDYGNILIESFEKHSQAWQNEESFDFSSRISDVTLDVVTNGIIGIEFSEAEKKQLRKTIDHIYALQTRYLILGSTATSLFSPLAFGYRKRAQETRQLFQAKAEEGSKCPLKKGYIHYFNQKEINTRNPTVDIGQKKLVDELLGLTVAGIDTVSIATTWAVRILLQRQDILSKIREEADSVLNNKALNQISHEDLPYTRSVLLETLRLYPPFPVIVKQSVEEMIIDGAVIPAKSPLFFSAYSIHRDARWYPEPSSFVPERWDGPLTAVNQSTFLPFGTGTHRCLGWELGLLEGCLILALLYSRFDVISAVSLPACSIDQIPYTMKINLTPRGSLPIRLKPRA